MSKFLALMKAGRGGSTRKRVGSSMIEVIVMVGVTSMMLVMTTTWIHQTMKQSSRFRAERRNHLAVSQLSQHFRKHAWLSSAADLSDEKSIVLTNPAGDQFTYRVNGQHMDQQIQFIHQDAAGQTQALERFVLPIESSVTFDRVNDSRVALKIEKLPELKTDGTSKQASQIYQTITPTLTRWLTTNSPAPASRDQPSPDDAGGIE